MQKVIVTVPATSANLGPGFDSLGIALTLYARFEFTLTDGALEFEGCPEKYQNSDNLVYTAFRAVYERMGKSVPGVRIGIHSDIPTARGMGSSSACLTGGAVGANALLGCPLSREEILDIVTKLEGHPDNVTPALLGGFTAAAMEKGKPVAVTFPVHEAIRLCAVIPSFELSTERSRKALPESVTLKDAIFNVSRIPMLIKAFEEASAPLFDIALHDRLHQPYREHLIENCKFIRLKALAAGAVGVYLSGAGPTIMAVYLDDAMPKRLTGLIACTDSNWKVLPLKIDTRGTVWEESQ